MVRSHLFLVDGGARINDDAFVAIDKSIQYVCESCPPAERARNGECDRRWQN